MDFYETLKKNFSQLDNVVINNPDDIKYYTLTNNNYPAFDIYITTPNTIEPKNIENNFNSTNEYPHFNIFGDWGNKKNIDLQFNKTTVSNKSYDKSNTYNPYSNLSQSQLNLLLNDPNISYIDKYNILKENPQYIQDNLTIYQDLYNQATKDVTNQDIFLPSLNTRNITMNQKSNTSILGGLFGDWNTILKNSLK